MSGVSNPYGEWDRAVYPGDSWKNVEGSFDPCWEPDVIPERLWLILREIRSEAYVLDTNSLNEIVDRIHKIVNRRCTTGGQEHVECGGSDDTVTGRQQLQHLVWLVSRMVVETLRIRVRASNWLCGHLYRIQGSSFATMGEINQYTQPVHLLNSIDTKVAQPRVTSLHASIPD